VIYGKCDPWRKTAYKLFCRKRKAPEWGSGELVRAVAFGDLAFKLSGDHEGHARQGGVRAFDVRLIPIRFPEVPAFGSVLDGELGQGVGAFDVVEDG
jgi:hypothetical protein